MAQDIRELLKNDKPASHIKLTEGHEQRFEKRLDSSFTKTTGMFFSIPKIAAVGIVLIGIAFLWFQNPFKQEPVSIAEEENVDNNLQQEIRFTLGDLSPELKQIENYYLTGINMKLTGLKITEENKEFLKGYMERLQFLDAEYNNLNKELNTLGPNEETITALIENLKLRLDLLINLKNKLNQFKQSKNEQITPQQI